MDELKKWSPIAFDHLQPAKKLIGFVANVVTAILLAQTLGLDVHRLSNGYLTPDLKLWHSLIAWIIITGVWFRLSNEQEYRQRNGVGSVARHVIRNAISAIKLANAYLRTNPDSEQTEKSLDTIDRAIRTILRAIEKDKAEEAAEALAEIGPETKPPGE